ncbi:MAG: N-acetylmuramoyl-L-alanine amidase [Flavobacteriales bacterium]|nr:MAG: N-acetylmuramoyl-L-alanine amidase [Flavobacteriales bacterium]
MRVKSQQNPKTNVLFRLFQLILIGIFVIAGSYQSYGQDKLFTVVIDAGHGGKDSGALGKKSKEKDIVLSVALKVGQELKDKHKDIKVIYTRDKDVFVELHKRGAIANKAHADLFVSIHANSVKSSSAHGTETFVLGVHRNATNLAVAKKENDVILLEENYEKHYDYNPKDPTSIIGLTLMQEDFLDQSIRLAKLTEKNYSTSKQLRSRGIKQAGLIVLHQTYMPSILTEIGFLSNRKEEAYLRSDKGQQKITKSIVDAIVTYKHELDQIKASVEYNKAKDESEIIAGVVFKVQISTGSKALATKPYNFKGLQPIERQKTGNHYKYYYGKTSDYKAAKRFKTRARAKGYKDAFIVAFKNGKKISVREALKKT